MKAISLWQPWATAMAVGAKHIETRSWSTNFTGLLAIHAAKKKINESLVGFPIDSFLANLGSQDYGAVVGVVMLYECCPTERLIGLLNPVNKGEECWGDYSPGRYCWLTRDPKRLSKPVLCRGMQGLFTLPSDVETFVRAQL